MEDLEVKARKSQRLRFPYIYDLLILSRKSGRRSGCLHCLQIIEACEGHLSVATAVGVGLAANLLAICGVSLVVVTL